MRQLGAILLGALAASAGAQEAPLTFQSALDLAIANNLDLAAARRGRAVREAEVKAAGQHPNPDLVFESPPDALPRRPVRAVEAVGTDRPRA